MVSNLLLQLSRYNDMKKIYSIVVLALLLFVSGCIHNDLPYPVISGDVLSIELNGQRELTIDSRNRIITVVLNDTVDIRAIKVNELTITDDASSTLNKGDIIDFSTTQSYEFGESYLFTISTFQDYEWQIVATQPIERKISLSGIIGEASFDTFNYSAVVKVTQDQDLYNIVVSDFVLAPSVATYTPDPYTLSNFSKDVEIEVEYFGIVENWSIQVQHSLENVITNTPSPWSRFAYLSGSVNSALTSTSGFEYKEQSASDWEVLEVAHKDGILNGVATGLKPNTSYVCRAFIGGDYGEEISFTTYNEAAVPNLNFDDAYQDGKTWYFNASDGNSYWATGNEGVITAGKESSTTSVTGNEAVSGNAVRMVTYNDVLMVQVAAGNLFTGTYSTVFSSDPVAALKSATFGRPYTGRPTALKGWYRYSPETITDGSYWQKAATEFDVNFADSVGKSDWCHIYIVLEKWPDGETVRPENEDLITTIAYGELRNNEKVSNYTEFTIPLEYYTLYEIPTHITIVSTSSINGGYFCGASGSVLYVDEFSLDFEYIE